MKEKLTAHYKIKSLLNLDNGKLFHKFEDIQQKCYCVFSKIKFSDMAEGGTDIFLKDICLLCQKYTADWTSDDWKNFGYYSTVPSDLKIIAIK
jgi:hypothetical protein